MGSSTSTVKSASGSGPAVSKTTMIKSKFESAAKTGVLNISDLGLKPQNATWGQLGEDAMVAKLKTLDISGNQLKTIPPEVYSLVNLKALFITGCNLQNTKNLTALVKLTKLKLDHNDLEVDKLAPLPTSLTVLDLSFNHFSGIPANLNGLVNLISIDLSNNRLESLYGIDGMPGLIEINLDDNLLTELPESISILVNLKKISLQRNRIGRDATTRPGQSLPAGLLENSSLNHIDLSGNVGLTKAEIMKFNGIETFLERKRMLSDKALSGGALVECSLFGLD